MYDNEENKIETKHKTNPHLWSWLVLVVAVSGVRFSSTGWRILIRSNLEAWIVKINNNSSVPCVTAAFDIGFGALAMKVRKDVGPLPGSDDEQKQ